MIKLICLNCEKEFYRYSFVLKTGRGKYCSKKCSSSGLSSRYKGKIIHPKALNNLKKMTSKRALELGFGKWMTGKKLSEETKKKIGLALKGGNSGSFKKGSHPSFSTEFKKTGVAFSGSIKEYKALHYWVNKKLGKPMFCEKCNNNKDIEWANKSRKYLKDLSDWLSLCPKCHFQYDKGERRGVHAVVS